MMRFPGLLWYVLAGVLVLSLSACSPSLYPLYRDYEVETEDRPIAERIEQALLDAGWESVPASAPNAIATQERKVRTWGLYSVVVSLEAVPVGDDYVRLYVHPYRRYFTGNRSKIPFLKSSLRRAVLKDVNEAFQDQGLVALGTGVSRDRQSATR